MSRRFSRIKWGAVALAAGLIAAGAQVPPASAVMLTCATTMASRWSAGVVGDSARPSISSGSSGSAVAFESYASDPALGDVNPHRDVFVSNWSLGTIEPVSFKPGGPVPNGESAEAAISAAGDYVAFSSIADNIPIAGADQNGNWDVFLRSRTNNNSFERVSISNQGTEATEGQSYGPSVDEHANAIAFTSTAGNLVNIPGLNASRNVYVRDRTKKTTALMSKGEQGPGDAHSQEPSISLDGKWVAFSSWASNLVKGQSLQTSNIYLRNRESNEFYWVTKDANGGPPNGPSYEPSVSKDGNYVAFWSEASDLLPNGQDTNKAPDVFVWSKASGKIERVSVTSAEVEVKAASRRAAISSDGRFVVFWSGSSQLVGSDTNGQWDAFRRDRWNGGNTERVSVGHGCSEGTGDTESDVKKPDGGIDFGQVAVNDAGDVAFTSKARLRSRDTVGSPDVWRWRLVPLPMRPASW